MASIFISYRRTDTLNIAFQLQERLLKEFGDDVFLDEQSLSAGVKWRDELRHKVQNAQIVLALIGKDWLNAEDQNGLKLKQAGDWVRQEIETALESEHTRLIPVYIGKDTPFVTPNELPDSIQELAEKQNIVIREGSDFKNDIKKLISKIKQVFKEIQSAPGYHPQVTQVARMSFGGHTWHGYAISPDTLLTVSQHCVQAQKQPSKLGLCFVDNNNTYKACKITAGADLALIQFTPSLKDVKPLRPARGRPQRDIDCVAVSSEIKSSLFKRPIPSSVHRNVTLNYDVQTSSYSVVSHEDLGELAGCILFHKSYAVGIIDSDASIYSHSTWHHESQLCKDLTTAIQPRGWVYAPDIRAPKPTVHFHVHVHGSANAPKIIIRNDTGLVLDERVSAFSENFAKIHSALKLAQVFQSGKSQLTTQLGTGTARHMAQKLGLWLTNAIFGNKQTRRQILSKAGWHPSEDLADRAIHLSISCTSQTQMYLALPWKTMAFESSSHGRNKPCFLGQSSGWVVTLEPEQSQPAVTIKRPADILLIQLNHSDVNVRKHLEQVRRIIKHCEKRTDNEIQIINHPKALYEALDKTSYDLIYIFGGNLSTQKDGQKKLCFPKDEHTDEPLFLEVNRLQDALKQKPCSMLVLNTSGPNTEGLFDIVQMLKPHTSYLIANLENSEVIDNHDYGLQLIRGIFRHAEAPEHLSWYSDTWSDSKWYNPAIFKQGKEFKPSFSPIESLRNIDEILHQLDREYARREVHGKIEDTLDKGISRIQGLSFIYVGLPGNEVSAFADGLARYVDDKLEKNTIIQLHVAGLPDQRPMDNIQAIRKHIVVRFEESLKHQKHQLEDYKKSRNKNPLILWINWGYHDKEDHMAFVYDEIILWHVGLKNILEPNSVGLPSKTLLVTTYGKELGSNGDHSHYKERLEIGIREKSLRRGTLRVDTLVELGNITNKHIEDFIEFAPHIFDVPEEKIDKVADLIVHRSDKQYKKAQEYLKRLYLDGYEDFLANHNY